MINELCLRAIAQCMCDRGVSTISYVKRVLKCAMDAEKQPLLGHTSDVRCRRLRTLTYDEVQTARRDVSWRRSRFCLVLMFWALMATFLSVITYILAVRECATDFKVSELKLSVPPVHMSFSPLISRLSNPVMTKNDDDMINYTL